MNTTKTLAPLDAVRADLQRMAPQFAMALPSNVTPEKFVRVIVTAIQNNPKLLEANRQSLYSATMKCATDGLIPDGREAALVPFKDTVNYLPMVGGLMKKARNSGEISTIDAQVVCQNDKYDAWIDEKGQHFRHEKARGERGPAFVTYAYAITKDGGFFFEEIDEEQMKAIENSSRAKDGPWNGPFRDEMKRKSAIRRLAKYRLPSSADLDEVVRRDDDMYELEKEEKAEPNGKPSRLGKIIDQQVDAQPAVDVPATPAADVPI